MLWMELYREKWPGLVNHAFIGAIISIGEENLPIRREGIGVNSIAMVLRGYETAPCCRVGARLVLPTVTVSVKWRRQNGLSSHRGKFQEV